MAVRLPDERLSRRENAVMGAVFTLSGGKQRFLVAPFEILALLPARAHCDERALDGILRALELDGYFDLVSTSRKGEKTYVVCMREAGLAYRRSDAQRRRQLLFRIAFTVACGLLSAAVGILLKALLS